MRRTGREPSALELALWRHMVSDVRPLEPARGSPEPEKSSAPVTVLETPAKTKLHEGASPGPTVPKPQAAPGGVDRRTLQRLQRGQYPISSRLDLHGLTQAEAHAKLADFVTAQHLRGNRCVLVITGRGRASGGVLRHEVPRWLASGALAPKVLAVSPARVTHGAEGALYVLLRRQRGR
jgi:DNA-nicking Smr family endonuclease